MIKGTGISKGIGIGMALVLKKKERKISNFKIENPEEELKLFKNVMNEVIKDTENLISTLDNDEKEIMEAHLLILQDPTLTDETINMILKEKINMGYAVDKGFDTVVKMFEAIDDEYLSARARDIVDIKERVLAKILNEKTIDLTKIEKGTIIVTKELTTSDTAKLNFKNVEGIITEIGGPTSHTSIMAKSHGIPAISGVENACELFRNDDNICMNGENGEIILNPSKAEITEFKKLKKDILKNDKLLEKYRGKKSKSLDGKIVELVSNIGNLKDAVDAIENDTEGVGLFRSEFLYMDNDHMPTEEEQFEAYKNVAQKMQGKNVIIRTLDVGGDKDLKYFKLPKEANPFLGERAIRLCLDVIDIFKVQIRALLRASKYGDISIMFPMISSIEELRKAKDVVETCKRELDKEKIKYNKEIKVGIMIEIPAAALNAENLAKECDFFSIGTNDLIQYTVAVERGNEKISNLYTKFHPSVIKLIKMAIDGAHKAGIKCGMCGEAAGNELYIPVLLGLGLDEFSMRSNNILNARKIISNLDSKKCKTLANKVLKLASATEVESKIKEFMK